MTEKISIFDVEISCIKAKEAMMQAIGFMKDDSVNTIELVSMESLMKEHENPEWKKKVSMQDLVLPGSVESQYSHNLWNADPDSAREEK